MSYSIFSVVEGHGETTALPILLRRIFSDCGQNDVYILPPWRLGRDHIANTTKSFCDVLSVGCARLKENSSGGAIIVLIDSDDDCPVQVGQRIKEASELICSDSPVRAILAKREFEAWFLASAKSLRGHRRVRPDANPPTDPEAIRDAKGHMQREILRPGEYYAPTVDQAAFSAAIDLTEARTASSFDKLYRDIKSLC